MEEVEKIKYLDYIFTSTNSKREHIKSQTNKAKRIIKIVWGLMKRAKIEDVNQKLYLFETLIK